MRAGDGAAIAAEMSSGTAADVTGSFEPSVRFFPAPAAVLHFHSDFLESRHGVRPYF